MPDKKELVINTGPIIALVAATGGVEILQFLYSRIVVPPEVKQEIQEGGSNGFARAEFNRATFFNIPVQPTQISNFLRNAIDIGEASVIQQAIDLNIATVCIDEAVGRRCARLNGLRVTGSIGILIRAMQLGYPVEIRTALDNMQKHGIWLSRDLITTALKLAKR